MKQYDIAIVGSGPAGLTAAMYARRAGKSVLILEKETLGGQITFSPKVENFPTIPAISGSALAEKLLEQAQGLGAEVELDMVKAIEAVKQETGRFVLRGTFASYLAKSVILATGSKHRTLGLPSEERFAGAGICYCAVCDGAFFRGKPVAVVGGGNTALQDAMLLAELCPSVTILQNLPTLTGDRVLCDRVQHLPNVTVQTGVTVTDFLGDETLSGVAWKDDNGQPHSAEVNGVFVAIGQQPETALFRALTAQDSAGYIVSDESCGTQMEGLFVAGDCRTKSMRQVVTALADGATAAMAACQFLDQST